MNKIFVFLAAILILLPLNRAHAVLVDRVVAIVNDDVITLSEVEQEGKETFSADCPAGPGRRA